ncbi:MAG: GNAT family N-acetyltransferase [Tahibacter sp.]
MNNRTSEVNTNQLLVAWVHGWAISRRTAAAIKLPNGCFKIHVGVQGHVARYILPGSDLSEIRSVATDIVEPGTWLKAAAPPNVVSAVLPEWWSVQAAEYLMGSALTAEVAARVPTDYQLSIQTEEMAATATLTHASGELAATARVGISGTFAIFDQVVTEPNHRRKGLGSVVMQSLRNHAISMRAVTGVLVATEDGLALYRALGWYLSTPMTAAVIPVPASVANSYACHLARDA